MVQIGLLCLPLNQCAQHYCGLIWRPWSDMVEKSMRAVDSWSQSFCDEAQTSWREKCSFAKWGTIPLISPPKFVNAKWVPRYLFFQVMRGYKKRKMIKNCNCAITESETWFYAGIKFTQMAFLSNFRKGWKSVFSRIGDENWKASLIEMGRVVWIYPEIKLKVIRLFSI